MDDECVGMNYCDDLHTKKNKTMVREDKMVHHRKGSKLLRQTPQNYQYIFLMQMNKLHHWCLKISQNYHRPENYLYYTSNIVEKIRYLRE